MRKVIVFVIFASLFLLVGLAASAGSEAKEILTWQNCIQEASKNNPDLVVAGEAVYQSQALKAITTSGVFPQLTANASAGETKTTPDFQKTTTLDSYSYGVTGSLLIFDGFKSSNNIKSAVQNIVAAQEAYRFSSADVRLQLRIAFVDLLKAQELVRVTQDIAKIREDELKLISLRYKAGLEHKGALLATQASMTQAKFDLEQAVRNLDLAQRQLNKEMGRKEVAPFEINEKLTVQETFHQKPNFQAIANDHPSVKQALAKRNSAGFSLKADRGSYYPQISLQAGANKDGHQWPPEDRGLNAQLVVSVPFFEGGLRKAQLSQAASVLRQAEAQLRSIEDSTVLNLEQAWESFREAVEAVESAKESLAADEERSRIAEAQYSTGFITYDNWTIIEDNIVQSKKAYLNAQANALLAEAQWIKAKGETLEYASQ
ncbi:MAG: TolC family protein [Candidatus Omnitrophica bacterium]|nr:TolC family protein [Candidatus Omnitrophota bacterium]